jgi:hypothetical protein
LIFLSLLHRRYAFSERPSHFVDLVRLWLYGRPAMFVQFSVTPVVYGFLLKNVDRSTAAFPPLLNAYLHLDTTTWLVTCRPLDGIRILQLAQKACPNAAPAIMSGIHKSSAHSQVA